MGTGLSSCDRPHVSHLSRTSSSISVATTSCDTESTGYEAGFEGPRSQSVLFSASCVLARIRGTTSSPRCRRQRFCPQDDAAAGCPVVTFPTFLRCSRSNLPWSFFASSHETGPNPLCNVQRSKPHVAPPPSGQEHRKPERTLLNFATE